MTAMLRLNRSSCYSTYMENDYGSSLPSPSVCSMCVVIVSEPSKIFNFNSITTVKESNRLRILCYKISIEYDLYHRNSDSG